MKYYINSKGFNIRFKDSLTYLNTRYYFMIRFTVIIIYETKSNHLIYS